MSNIQLTFKDLPKLTIENIPFWRDYLCDSLAKSEFTRLPKINKRIRIERLLHEMVTSKKVVVKE